MPLYQHLFLLLWPGPHYPAMLAWNLVRITGWPGAHDRSSCLSIQSGGLTDKHHHDSLLYSSNLYSVFIINIYFKWKWLYSPLARNPRFVTEESGVPVVGCFRAFLCDGWSSSSTWLDFKSHRNVPLGMPVSRSVWLSREDLPEWGTGREEYPHSCLPPGAGTPWWAALCIPCHDGLHHAALRQTPFLPLLLSEMLAFLYHAHHALHWPDYLSIIGTINYLKP